MSIRAEGPAHERDVAIINRQGLHARAAKQFVDLARTFQAQITVAKGRQVVDAKDIWDVMTLAAEQGTRLRLRARGPAIPDRCPFNRHQTLVSSRCPVPVVP